MKVLLNYFIKRKAWKEKLNYTQFEFKSDKQGKGKNQIILCSDKVFLSVKMLTGQIWSVLLLYSCTLFFYYKTPFLTKELFSWSFTIWV